MALSRKSKSSSLHDHLKVTLSTHVKPNDHLVVALSGGIDSVVLLDALMSHSEAMQFSLSAVHVNHGISENASYWGEFCSKLCHTRNIPISVTELNIKHTTGQSLEATARDARYHIFNHLTADYVVLAQHQDDQAETLFLQLLRGAGVKGLAAMPIIRKQASDTAPQILRPLLKVPRREIEDYANQKQLNWIEDESNENTCFNRNFLRHKIFPQLEKRYPSYKTTFSRTSRHLAEASGLLDELALLDKENCSQEEKLRIDRLAQLSQPRAKNLLRYIFSQHGVTLPNTAKLDNLLHQLASCRSDNQLKIPLDNLEIRCYKGAMDIIPKTATTHETLLSTWDGEEQLTLKQLNGLIHFEPIKNAGISLQKLRQHTVTVRLRHGGERFKPNKNRPRRSLKKLLYEADIPPWERSTLPLLFSGEQLVWVPNIGIDSQFQAITGELGVNPTWRPSEKHV